jgi:hypothetical protein
MLTGNIGQPGAGCHRWAGNYKAALFQGSAWTGPGFKGCVAEDPFHLTLDETRSEVTASCSNPFLQVWKGGIPPVFDSKDDLAILAGIARSMADVTGDTRFVDMFKFEPEGKRDVYLQRLLDTSTATKGYAGADIMAGKHGPPGGALLNFRTYPRIPFYEQVHDSEPFHTDTGRLHAYADVPEAIGYGENFIVHREGPEATPYLPNVIVSSNPIHHARGLRYSPRGRALGRPHDPECEAAVVSAKTTKNFLWERGYQFYCLTPKTRHRVHSGWSNADWHMLYDSNFGVSAGFPEDSRTHLPIQPIDDRPLHEQAPGRIGWRTDRAQRRPGATRNAVFTHLKAFVRRVRPPPAPEPVIRFETPAGRQAQVDFAHFRFPWGVRTRRSWCSGTHGCSGAGSIRGRTCGRWWAGSRRRFAISAVCRRSCGANPNFMYP